MSDAWIGGRWLGRLPVPSGLASLERMYYLRASLSRGFRTYFRNCRPPCRGQTLCGSHSCVPFRKPRASASGKTGSWSYNAGCCPHVSRSNEEYARISPLVCSACLSGTIVPGMGPNRSGRERCVHQGAVMNRALRGQPAWHRSLANCARVNVSPEQVRTCGPGRVPIMGAAITRIWSARSTGWARKHVGG